MRKNVINLVILFIFFFVIFTIFKMDTMLKIILAAGISIFFVILPYVMAKINESHANYYLKKVRMDAVRGFHISPEEAKKLFYLDEKTFIRVNLIQLEKLDISETSKQMLSTIERLY